MEHNALLSIWYAQQPINLVESLIHPVWTNISINHLIDNFHYTLGMENLELANIIWSNDAVKDWYKGEAINFGSTTEQAWYMISKQLLVAGFELATHAGFNALSTFVWNQHPLIQQAYNQIPISDTVNNQDVTLAISPFETIQYFKRAVSTGNEFLIKVMWESCALIRQWYSSESVNLGENGAPNNGKIGLEDLITIFQSVSAGNILTEVCNDMWTRSTIVRGWYHGFSYQRCDTETETTDESKIHPVEFLKTFMHALDNKNSFLVTSLWESTIMPQDLFMGQAVNVGAKETPTPAHFPSAKLISNFRAFLAIECKKIVLLIWNKIGSELIAFYTNRPGTISKQELIADFTFFVSGGYTDIAMTLWQSHPPLRFWFIDKAFYNDSDYSNISFSLLINLFICALKNRNDLIALNLITYNPRIKSSFSGHAVNVSDNPTIQDIQAISLEELLCTYNIATNYSNNMTANAIRQSNPSLELELIKQSLEHTEPTEVLSISTNPLVSQYQQSFFKKNNSQPIAIIEGPQMELHL